MSEVAWLRAKRIPRVKHVGILRDPVDGIDGNIRDLVGRLGVISLGGEERRTFIRITHLDDDTVLGRSEIRSLCYSLVAHGVIESVRRVRTAEKESSRAGVSYQWS